MVTVFIEEEYGYAYYTWDYPGFMQSLISDWNKGRMPFEGHAGLIQEIRLSESLMDDDALNDYFARARKAQASADATVYLHEIEDTKLVVGGKVYRHPRYAPEPTIWHEDELG